VGGVKKGASGVGGGEVKKIKGGGGERFFNTDRLTDFKNSNIRAARTESKGVITTHLSHLDRSQMVHHSLGQQRFEASPCHA
jgi:hypothetical protein